MLKYSPTELHFTSNSMLLILPSRTAMLASPWTQPLLRTTLRRPMCWKPGGQVQSAMEVYIKCMELDPNSDEAKIGYSPGKCYTLLLNLSLLLQQVILFNKMIQLIMRKRRPTSIRRLQLLKQVSLQLACTRPASTPTKCSCTNFTSASCSNRFSMAV